MVRRLLLACVSALASLNIWTGAPLLAIWVGSRFEGWLHPRSPGNGVTMRAVFVVVVVLGALEILLMLVIGKVTAAYDDLTGRPPEARRTSPWLRSMRGEREEFARRRAGISPIERVLVLSVIAAAIAAEYWFFFLAGSSLGNGD